MTHWGFIRALTGLKVPNGTVLRIDPTQRDHPAEMLFVPTGGAAPSAPLMQLPDPC